MDGLLEYAIPIMIAMVFVNFFWAWILTAAKPPKSPTGNQIPDTTEGGWRYFDAGPEGVRKNLGHEIQRQTKSV
jgi:hypothetical protein